MNSSGRLQFTKCDATMRHFRCLYDIKDVSDPKVVKTGSASLHYSGSGQFGAMHLPQLQAKVDQVAREQALQKPEIWILDLRTERHFFSDGNPIVLKVEKDHLLDASKSKAQIIEEESKLISGITKTTSVWDRNDQPTTMGDVITSEKDLVETQGWHYLRLPILEHFKPTDDVVEELVTFVQTHPQAWIHAHCYVKERTTEVLALIDMLHYASQVSFDDILFRQRAMDGSDLTKIPGEDSEFHQAAKERLELLRKFYAYCQVADPLHNPACQKWTEWLKSAT